jgi:hypothetical protein
MELSSADERMAALEAQLDSLREAAVLPEAAQQRVDSLREAAEGHAAEYSGGRAARVLRRLRGYQWPCSGLG